uniref:TFIIS central domain-containing protein n=1 Tax=Neogobius melanostomus TaxID=47308 RepID=A0A8C6U723_9GOBI
SISSSKSSSFSSKDSSSSSRMTFKNTCVSTRVSDSDDLKMTESEVGKLAFAIEREMFNLCLSTDSKYKNKYRSLMLHLKDPKNKGLFYRVIGGEVTPFRLVRLSSEELLSKEISEWRKTEVSEVFGILLYLHKPFYTLGFNLSLRFFPRMGCYIGTIVYSFGVNFILNRACDYYGTLKCF